ncbi:conserved hypothetical protein [Hyella patelloides LEGE 07179]|uniref:Uncharacterized protein n=1 Tax=Hyella patelloides LEGE 07179 TaxID=945734 RepID=A0A563VPM6_9CYAN|nr:conserved hypothetical protein [Hyella patelloides LEGE 07179]
MPGYNWVFKNYSEYLLTQLRQIVKEQNPNLLNDEINGNIDNLSKPLSYAYLSKKYLEK